MGRRICRPTLRPPKSWGATVQQNPTNTSGNTNAKIQVEFDGRFRTSYPQSIVDEHFDFILGPSFASGRFRTSDADPYRALRTGNPDLVLINREQVPSTQAMQRQDDWVLLYQDALAQLWGRTEKYGDPRSEQFVPLENRITGDLPQQGFASWPAFPNRDQPQITVAGDTDETMSVSLSEPHET